MDFILLNELKPQDCVICQSILHAACMGKERNVRGVLVRKTERKRPFGNSRCRWENIIRINAKGKEWEGVDWVDVFQGVGSRTCLVNTLMKVRVLQNAINFLPS